MVESSQRMLTPPSLGWGPGRSGLRSLLVMAALLELPVPVEDRPGSPPTRTPLPALDGPASAGAGTRAGRIATPPLAGRGRSRWITFHGVRR